MVEPGEIVCLLANVILFLFFIRLYKEGKCQQMPKIWIWGLVMITGSNIFTVAEGFVLVAVFNMLEHLFLLCASLFFFVGAFHMKTSGIVK
ncbi:MAG: hypothetical protein JW717_06165 [Marinilabiliaceae bacterium]|nr:hypothetical protein [Marinilabiliaceae bacterium]